MNIVTKFDISQKKFHHYWLPLMYKHQECTFYITASHGFIYPKDLNNLKDVIFYMEYSMKIK